MKKKDDFHVGIDASNLLTGGGRSHIIELLDALVPENHGVSRVVIWGDAETLELLPTKKWLSKVCINSSRLGIISRLFWQLFLLPKEAKITGIDVLFSPGGIIGFGFHPAVTMSQNMLPFEWKEMRRYGVSKNRVRIFMLRLFQTNSFKRADGVVFLTRYAEESIKKVTGSLKGTTAIIPHGINRRFFNDRSVRLASLSRQFQYRLVYVSVIDVYKHHCNVMEAVSRLRGAGYSVFLDLIGQVYSDSKKLFYDKLKEVDPNNEWITVHGNVPFDTIHELYEKADIGIFASSCENLPIILLEKMAAGLPIACSDRGPMREVLGDAGVYFDPEKPEDIVDSVALLLDNAKLKKTISAKALERSTLYSWDKCSYDTFSYLTKIISIDE